MQPIARESIAERLEGASAIDPLSEGMQRITRAAIPTGTPVKDLLSGTWLGHPLHPPLTDVVIGCWTSAVLLDLLGGPRSWRAADRLIGLGILASLPTAAAGLSDWAELKGPTRRVGSFHAMGNSAALGAFSMSWLARRRGQRVRGVALALAGMGVATFSAWLGGHLSFAKGVGVSQVAFEQVPDDWTQIAAADDVPEGEPVRRDIDGVGVLLVRRDGVVRALHDRCSHRGCPLSEGSVDGDTVTCGCHGSVFELARGSVRRGPATSPQPVLEVREVSGRVEVRRARTA